MNYFLRFGRLVLVAVISGYGLGGQLLAQSSGPTLRLPPALPAVVGQRVTVPIDFRPGGDAVAGLTFSIDFDESCLGLDASDQDGNGLLDRVRFTLPAAFQVSVAYAAADTDGELDVVIADYAPPIASLPSLDGIVAIDFMPLCSTPDNTPVRAAIRFASAPAASFGAVDGRDLSGVTQDGAVLITLVAVATLTPTVTPIATVTATVTTTATATPSGSATAIATTTPMATDPATTTPMATDPATATPMATGTLIPTAIPNATATPLPTHQPWPLFLPLLRQE